MLSRRFAALAVLALIPSAVRAEEAPAEKITYADHVLPVLRQRCGSCHNANDKKGSLVVDNYAALMAGGSSGARFRSRTWSRTGSRSRGPRTPSRRRVRSMAS